MNTSFDFDDLQSHRPGPARHEIWGNERIHGISTDRAGLDARKIIWYLHTHAYTHMHIAQIILFAICVGNDVGKE